MTCRKRWPCEPSSCRTPWRSLLRLRRAVGGIFDIECHCTTPTPMGHNPTGCNTKASCFSSFATGHLNGMATTFAPSHPDHDMLRCACEGSEATAGIYGNSMALVGRSFPTKYIPVPTLAAPRPRWAAHSLAHFSTRVTTSPCYTTRSVAGAGGRSDLLKREEGKQSRLGPTSLLEDEAWLIRLRPASRSQGRRWMTGVNPKQPPRLDPTTRLRIPPAPPPSRRQPPSPSHQGPR
jgi:hypothetical protein